MELLRLFARFNFYSILWCKDFIRDWPPTILFDALVPAVKVVVFWFVICDIDCIFPLVLFEFHIVTRSKCIDVDNATVSKDLIVD